MGITLYFFNHTRKEYISPFNGTCKAWEILANHPSLSELLAYSMMELGQWNNCFIEAVGDPDDYLGYEDVTVPMIIGYNMRFGDWALWGPESFSDHIIVPSKYSIKDNAKVMIGIERDLSSFIEDQLSKGRGDQWWGWIWSRKPSHSTQGGEPSGQEPKV